MVRKSFLGALLAGLVLAGSAAAEPPKEAIPLGSDGCNHTFARAGYSDQLSCLASPSVTPNYCGYYVGGGCACGGGPPGPLQGTWGWDYCHTCCLAHRVALGWCHRYQSGIGSYRTDFIHVPNVFALLVPKNEEHHEGKCCIPTPPLHP